MSRSLLLPAVSAAEIFLSSRGSEQTVMAGIALSHYNSIFQSFQLLPLAGTQGR